MMTDALWEISNFQTDDTFLIKYVPAAKEDNSYHKSSKKRE